MNRKLINIVVIMLVLAFAVGSVAFFTNGFDEHSLSVIESKTRMIKEGDELEGFYVTTKLNEFTKKDFDKLIEGIDPVVVKDEDTGEVKYTSYTLVEFDKWTKDGWVDGDDNPYNAQDINIVVKYYENGDIELTTDNLGDFYFVCYDAGQNGIESILTLYEEGLHLPLHEYSIVFGGNVAHVSKVNNAKELKKWVGGIFA